MYYTINMKWFISDLHFGHESVIKYCNRPFSSIEEMHDKLIKNWNSCIKEQDEVYILGDLALCKYSLFEPIGLQLKGIKYLIKGNHDHYSEAQYGRVGIKVFHEIKMKLAGHDVRLSHYPYAPRWYQKFFCFKSELRFLDRRPIRLKNETLLHGHTHTKTKLYKDGRIHVGVDAWNFNPVSQYEIEKLLNLKRKV